MTKMNFKTYLEAKEDFSNISQDENATAEQKNEALNSMMQALQAETKSDILKEAQSIGNDNSVLQSRGQNVLTNQERQFFNAVIEEGGFKDTDVLPVTTQERVFDDIVSEHPLLQAIGIQNLGAVTEFIYSDPEGAAVWGPLFGEIKGQLNTAFRKETISQLKLTAFIPIAKDMLQLGPEWIERYVRTILKEAMSIGLERGYVEGGGPTKDEPVGLLKDVDIDSGAVSDKASEGTLTFNPGRDTINELKGVVKKLSEKLDAEGNPKDKPRKIEGRVVMVTNPFDTFDIKANATTQNETGAYVTNLPFNPIMTESIFIPQGKVLFFVKDEYIAAIGGALDVKRYTETLALEDADVFIAKQFATGKPVDNNASVIYDLDVDLTVETP